MQRQLLILLLFPFYCFGQNFSDGFQFPLPPDDSTNQVFLPAFEKTPIEEIISITPDGHFQTGNTPIRFWGASMSQGACFPQKSKAPWIAGRLRKMGFNLVRFHNMDNSWSGEEGSIFYESSSTTTVLDFFALDRMHYFISELKSQGIYANIELHSARDFRSGDGVIHHDSIWDGGRAVNMFDERLIELQKQYMLNLLLPINPYTGNNLANEPAAAMFTITNANTLYGYWKSDWLEHFSKGGRIQQRHVDTLHLKWNNFLLEKYGDQTTLENAWNANASVGGLNEQVSDAGFENENSNGDWIMELHDVAEATITPDEDNPYTDNFSGRVDVINSTSTNWHIQFKQTGGTVEEGKKYTVKFAARAEDERQILLVLSRDNAPYNGYASANIQLTEEWQEYSFTFSPNEDNFENLRLGFQFFDQEGRYWFDDVSLTDAEVPGLMPNENILDGNIARMKYSERLDFTAERRQDMTEFYLQLQRNYFNELYDYLRNELGVTAPISGSNSNSGISDIFTQQDMDFMDDQFTWDYVRFPNGWSTSDWYIVNEPMVKSPYWTMANGLFGGLPMKDKPMIVSEFRIPFPNNYAVELMPWMASYGSFHDIDAAIFFEYNNSPDNWNADKVEDYYSIHRHTGHMALSPLLAYAFRNNLIAPAGDKIFIDYPENYINDLAEIDYTSRWGKYLPYDQRRSFEHSIRVGSFDGSGGPDLSILPPSPPEESATTNTGETEIDFTTGILKTSTPQFISVCGFLNESPTDANALKINSANNFGVVSWLSLDGNNLPDSEKSVLAISSRIQNSGMVWDGITSINNNWGGAPTEIQALNLNLELNINAPYIAIYPLDETGKEMTPLYFSPSEPGKFNIQIDQLENPTVWFGVEALETVPTFEISENKNIKVYPNPVGNSFNLNINGVGISNILSMKYSFHTALGQEVYLPTMTTCGGPGGNCTYNFTTGHLEKGIYFLQINLDGKIYSEKIVVE